MRAISPSSRHTSLMTAAGLSPASRESTDPSVCPVRTRTPPSRPAAAPCGRAGPGRPAAAGFASRRAVRARSDAEMPVPTPWRGCPSTDTAIAVPRSDVFEAAWGWSSRRSQSAAASATHR